MEAWSRSYLEAQGRALGALPTDAIAGLGARLASARAAGTHVFIAGNGGSAANAAHFAADLGRRSRGPGAAAEPLRCSALATNLSAVTALGNDRAFAEVFTGQLEALARPGDGLVCLSVSGDSPNLVHAARWAAANGLWTAALLGAGKGDLGGLVDLPVVVPDAHYGRAEDLQMTVCHLLSYAFEAGEL